MCAIDAACRLQLERRRDPELVEQVECAGGRFTRCEQRADFACGAEVLVIELDARRCGPDDDGRGDRLKLGLDARFLLAIAERRLRSVDAVVADALLEMPI